MKSLYAFFAPSARYHLVQFGTQMDLTYCGIPLHTQQGLTRIGKTIPPHLVDQIPEGTTLCTSCRRALEKRQPQDS
jgi:hypothetical protein